MRLTPLLFVVLVIAVIGLLSVAGLDSFAPASCSDAKASLDAGLTANAEKAYRAILADEPDSECAVIGMRTVARRRCAAADRLRLGGVPDEAKTQYAALLLMETPHLRHDTKRPPSAVRPYATRRAADPVLCGATGLKALEAAAAEKKKAAAEEKAAQKKAAAKAAAG